VVEVALDKAVGEPREPALRHAKREVLALDLAGAEVGGEAVYYVLCYPYYLARRIAAIGFRRLIDRFGEAALTVATDQSESHSKNRDIVAYANWSLIAGKIEAFRANMPLVQKTA
jgi:hypothetical protein